jgi:hypothetical protein
MEDLNLPVTATTSHLATGLVLFLMGEVGAVLTKDGVLNADGDFASPISAVAIAQAAADIEKILTAHGVTVQGNIEQALQALPLILQLIGLK